jgi:hypothetical protein
MNNAGWLMTIITIIGATTTVSIFARKLFKIAKRVIHFLDDYFGTEERPGFDKVPGVAERIKNIEENLGYLCIRIDNVEKEVTPNHGTSIKDQIGRIERRVLNLEEEII